MYDVIVVGAGPCGCTAAKTLSESGLKVLLLEKCKLPRYKSCSGVLIEKSVKLIERYFGHSVPVAVACTPFENCGMVFYDDSGKAYKFESCGLNIWRDKFDCWLTVLTKESGVEVKDESAVSSIRETGDSICVSVNGVNVYSKFVVDCSGVADIGKKAQNSIITYQTFIDGSIDLDKHYFYAYLQPELSGYDAWFNVKDDMLVLGVASPNLKDIKKYYGKFISYMEKTHALIINRELRSEKWLIRNIQPPFDIDYGQGGILKAGERAGFLNPMGEGISSALESGYFAACAIISNFNGRYDAIEDYKLRVSETKDYMQRQWRLAGCMSKKFAFMVGQ